MGGVVGSVSNGLFSYDRLERGTNAAIGGHKKADKIYQDAFADTEGDFQPFLAGGTEMWQKLMGLYGGGDNPDGGATSDFLTRFVENSPDYQFTRDQMIKSGDASASSRGRLFSGGYAAELQKNAGGLASTQLNNVLNRMMSFAGVGMGAADTLGRYREDYASLRGQGKVAVGDLKLARQLGNADIFSNTLADINDQASSAAMMFGGG